MSESEPRVDRDGALAAMADVRRRYPGPYWIHHPEGGWDFGPPPPLGVIRQWAEAKLGDQVRAKSSDAAEVERTLDHIARVTREAVDRGTIEEILRENGNDDEKRNARALAKAHAAVRCGRLA